MAAPAFHTPEHAKLVALVKSRRDFSQRHMSSRYDAWRENERQYRSFVDPDALDKSGKKKHPYTDSIVVPFTFAVMQTQLAFDVTAFTQRRPIIPLEGVGPEDVRPAKLMEQVLHYEWQSRRMLLELYTWLLDRRRYGLGILWNTWRKDVRTKTVETPKSLTLFGITVPMRGVTKTKESRTVFEGNTCHVVDPFQFWPDPRVPISRLQDGEFVGHTVRRAYSYMRQQAAGPDPFYVNVDHIPTHPSITRRGSGTSMGVGDDSDRDRILGLSGEFTMRGDTVDFQDKGYVDLDEFVIQVIPKDYSLGKSSEPEKSWVTLANDTVIVRAEPFEYEADEYPSLVMECSLDAHAGMNPGNPEILEGLQSVLSWLFNSHLASVKRILNGMFVVNPGMIELKDLLSPQHGLLIRLKREFYDRPEALDQAIKQLQTTDVTRGHLADMQAVIDLGQRVSATPENLQGVISSKDRTLGEQQMAVSSASARLRVEVQLAWVQGIVPWSQQRVANIQQLMSEERWLRIVDDWAKTLGVPREKPYVRVSRDQVQGDFTYEVIDGTVRGSDEMMKTWKELTLAVANNAVLQQKFSLEELFRFTAMLGGASNIDDFILQGPQMQVAPDEQVSRQVERGNLVPAGTGPSRMPRPGPTNGEGQGRNPFADRTAV